MCGIVGYCCINSIPIDFLVKANQSQIHRGPDDSGVFQFENNTIGLGHQRLSILDLSERAKQPMPSFDQTIWITFNGEIYNFRELKSELLKRGYSFKSESDTEVLIYGYQEWGESMVPKLKGMFAFCIYDAKNSLLFLARDRFGIKPLIYFFDGFNFAFASEIKALTYFDFFKRHLNQGAIVDYLNYYHIPDPKTIWKNVYKLKPAHTLTLKVGEQPRIKKYWSINPHQNNEVRNEETIHESWRLLEASVARHLESDVPIGLFLSSGIDSASLLTLMAQRGLVPNTFTIGFEHSSKSEHIEARELAELFKTNHFENILTGNYMSAIDNLISFYDEPFAITSMVSYNKVSNLASDHNKVVFSGDGGDEVFGGYKWYREILNSYKQRSIWEQIKQLKKKEKKKRFYQKQYLQHMTYEPQWTQQVVHKKVAQQSEDLFWPFELPSDYYDLHPVKVFQMLDFQYYIPSVNLQRADLSSMAESLEVRVPFLDNDLVDFCISLDTEAYFKSETKKYLLSQNLKQHLPPRFLNLPKRGFGNPLDTFFEKKETYITTLNEGRLMDSEILKNGVEFESLDKKQLWLLYGLDLWVKKWLNI